MRHVRSMKLSFAIALTLMVTFTTNLAMAATVTPSTNHSRSAQVSPTLSVSSQLSQRRYVASGDRAYELGSEDGRYPAMGFHTRGEMGGIWIPPIKLLDGIWFGVNDQWIGPATTFTENGPESLALEKAGMNGCFFRASWVEGKHHSFFRTVFSIG